jgi:hypothetical protein
MRQIHRGIATPQAEGVVARISRWRLHHGTELLVDSYLAVQGQY